MAVVMGTEATDEQVVIQQLKALQPHVSHPIYVAYSGGMDSTVLLHLMWRHRNEFGQDVRALHVHYSTEVAYNETLRTVRFFCQQHDIPLAVHDVQVSHCVASEAADRLVRYQAFEAVAPSTVLTAHHSDDSVETVLLNLLRGAGLRGVCGISNQYSHGEIHVLRPLLVWTAKRVFEYATAHQLQWCEDPSNQDMQCRRNWVRKKLLPLLKEKWPHAARSVLRFAGHMRCTQDALSVRARCDEEMATGEYGGWSREKLRFLGPIRVIEMIKRCFYHYNIPLPPAVRLEEWVKQVFQAQLLHQAAAVWYHKGMQCVLTTCTFWLVPKLMPVTQHFQAHVWHIGETSIDWPYVGGTIMVRVRTGHGLSLRLLKARPLSVGVRTTPSMKIALAHNRPHQLVKHVLREAKVPNWLRVGWPIVTVGDEVVAVVNFCVASHWQAQADEEGVVWTVRPLENFPSQG